MDTLTTLKALHWLASALLLGGVATVLFRAVSSWRGGDHRPFATTLDRPWWAAWLLMAVALASFPISGWWLVHTVGWPLGQTWLLASSCLYIAGLLGWFLLLAQARRLRASASSAVMPAYGRRVWVAAAFSLLVLSMLFGLMLVKPV